MLKISEEKRDKQTITLRLEGQIVGPWVNELKQVYEPLIRDARQLVLNLADVAYVDESGIATLTDLTARGARLSRATPFVKAQLSSAANKRQL